MTDTPPREFTGRDLVEALQEAARTFGVRRSELGHEVIENYGVGARGCVIRAWPKAGAGSRGGGGGERPPRDREFGGGRGADRDSDRGGGRGRGRFGERGGGGRRQGGFGGGGGGRGRDFGGRGGGSRQDLPDSVRAQAPPERSRGGMYDDAMPARLSDRPPGQRDDRPRRGAGFRRGDDRGGSRGGRGGREGARGPERRDRPEHGRSQGDWSQRGGQARRAPGGGGGGGAAGRHGGGRGGRGGEQGDDRQGFGGRRRRGRRGEPHPARRAHHDHEPPRREPTVPATAEHAAEVKDLFEEVIDRWGMELHATSSVDGDTVLVSIDGPDAERLAAEDGKLLDSLQYLLSKMTSRLLTDNVRVLLDAAGFRAGRDQDLRDRAIAKAHEALDAGKKLRLDPLNPYERRVVHLALKEIPGIRTYSIGRGYLKRVTVEPLRDDDEAQGDESEE